MLQNATEEEHCSPRLPQAHLLVTIPADDVTVLTKVLQELT